MDVLVLYYTLSLSGCCAPTLGSLLILFNATKIVASLFINYNNVAYTLTKSFPSNTSLVFVIGNVTGFPYTNCTKGYDLYNDELTRVLVCKGKRGYAIYWISLKDKHVLSVDAKIGNKEYVLNLQKTKTVELPPS